MQNISATVPDIAAPFVMDNGNINPVWFQFFLKLFVRTSSGNNPEIENLKIIVNALYGQDSSQVEAIPDLRAMLSQAMSLQGVAPQQPVQQPDMGLVPTHGLQTDEALHALATTTLAGFMSAADKVKLNGIAGAISCFSAYQSAAQAVALNTQTTITGYTKLFDDNTEFSTGTSAFVAAAAGTYVFAGAVTGTQAAATRRQLSLFVNGTQRTTLFDMSAATGTATITGSSMPIRLAANDSVTFRYLSGIADTTVVGQNLTFFGGWRIK